jgi:FtsH-binding integral membrane protein
MCANRGYMIACKVVTSIVVLIASVANVFYEHKRHRYIIQDADPYDTTYSSSKRAIDATMEASRRRHNARAIFWAWVVFDVAVFAGWLTIVIHWWPSSQWPALLIGFAFSMAWAVTVYRDVKKVKKQRKRKPTLVGTLRRSYHEKKPWYKCW